MLGLPQITDDQHVTRAALVDLYDRLALGLGEGGPPTPAPVSPPDSH
jgi:hypothetical protein